MEHHTEGEATMAGDTINVWHCPKCGKELRSVGTVKCDGESMPVFQCPVCVVRQDVFGEPFDVALTFAVNAAGKPVDPGDDRVL
jgi:hypothetical protein